MLIILICLAGCGITPGSLRRKTPTVEVTVIVPTETLQVAVEVPTQEIVPTDVPTITTCTVATGLAAGSLNVREGAGIEFAVKEVLSEGQKLTVITDGEWKLVQTGSGTIGFLKSTYCK